MKKHRILYVLKYLWRNTDEDHPATTAELLSALESEGITINRHTVVTDIEQLEEYGGFDTAGSAQYTDKFSN